MANSAEIAAQISAQQSWFMQQNAIASQIGVNPAAFGGGLGGWGMGGMAPAMMPHPGMGSMPGAFNYGAGFGYGAGNRAGALATSALSMAPALVGGAYTAGSMLFGSGMAPMTNPLGAFAMAKGAGFGWGASAGLAGMSMLPMAALGYGVNAMVSGAQQGAMIGQAVGNYNFANPSSMTGMGFSRQDAATIAQQVRQIAMVPEMMTSVQELTRILPQLRSMGVMTGVRDAAEFNKRLKDSIETIRQVSKVIGTSLEDASQFFAQSRGAGFFGREAQIQNAMNARVTGALTGMDPNQIAAGTGQAAAFGTAIGGQRVLSAQGFHNVSQRIGAAIQGNPDLQRVIENITGQQGDAAKGVAANMLLQIGQKLAVSAPGMLTIAGASKIGPDGKIDLDPDIMGRVSGGSIGKGELYENAGRNKGSKGWLGKFFSSQTSLGQKFAAQAGPEGIFAILKQAGLSGDLSSTVLQRHFDLSEEEANLVISLQEESQSGLSQQKFAIQQIISQQTLRRERGPGGWGKRMGVMLNAKLAKPLEQVSDDVRNAVGGSIENAYRDFLDDAVITVTDQKRREFLDAIAGKKSVPIRGLAFNPPGEGGLMAKVGAYASESPLWGMISGAGLPGTGMSDRGEQLWLGGMLGAKGGDPAAIRDQMSGLMQGRYGSSGAGFSPAVQAAVEAARRIEHELTANNQKYVDASPQERVRMHREEVLRRSQNRFQDPDMVLRKGFIEWSGSGIDAAGGIVAATGMHTPDEVTGWSATKTLSRVGVDTDERNARGAMIKNFREAAPGIMKSAGAQEFLKKYYALDPKKRQDLKRAIRNKDAAAGLTLARSIADMPNLSIADLLTIRDGIDNLDTGSASLVTDFENATNNSLAFVASDTLRQAADDAQASAKSVGGAMGAKIQQFGAAASGLADALVTGKGRDGAMSELGASVDSIASAVENMKGKERDAFISKLTAPLQIAVRRRLNSGSALQKLVGTDVSVASMKVITGLDEAAIGQAFGMSSAPDPTLTMRLTKGDVGRLASSASKRGALDVALTGGEGLKERQKEDEMIKALKAITSVNEAIRDQILGKSSTPVGPTTASSGRTGQANFNWNMPQTPAPRGPP